MLIYQTLINLNMNGFIMKKLNLKFRKCRKDDYEFYKKLLEDYVEKYFGKWDQKPFDRNWRKSCDKMFIIIKNKEEIGTFLLEEKKSCLYVSRLYIIKKYRGKGIGSYLLKHFENKTKKQRLRLHVWPNNPAVRLYRRFGYKVIKKEKNGKFLMEKIK